jgi:hypothetical protein
MSEAPGRDRVEHQFGHARAGEGRLEPARAHEQRELVAHLAVAHSEHAGLARTPDQGLEERLAPAVRLRLGREQHRHVGIVEPQGAQFSHRQVVAERARQHGAVDAARRSTRDDVDDDAQFDPRADLA